MKNDTITAIATPKGIAGISVIRVSGPDAICIADKIFTPIQKEKTLNLSTGYQAHYGFIIDNNEKIDDAIALVFRAPHSYTGEDVIEISCHGGLFLTQQILRLIIKNGARPADPGEFTKRAFLNGKIDLIKAEAVMNIISASGLYASRAAFAVHNGSLSNQINSIKNNLVSLAALLSVWCDYPDEDFSNLELNSLRKTLSEQQSLLKKLLDNYDIGKIIVNGVDTAIIGAPNVGKSSLMNMLSGSDRCIVTDIPGTTRDIVEQTINFADFSLHISDTAGIRETDDPIESIGVSKAKSKINSAELILFVLDGSNELTQHDIKLLKSVPQNNTIAIINKNDLPQKIDCNYIKNYVADIVHISAKNHTGLTSLQTALSNLIASDKVNLSEGILVNERQFVSVKNALSFVNEALNTLNIGLTLDAVTVCIESAINELLSLTGENASQLVVDEIFSKFCVGK